MPTYKHYFIRHAHRNEFKPNDWGHEISITLEGRQAAQHFGYSLTTFPMQVIWTSPVKRCSQTAEELKNGMGRDIPILTSTLLGDPGFMISNPKLAENAFQKYPLIELINIILEGKSVPGFYPIDLGCNRMLEEILKNKQKPSIWVSHDINVCLLACWIFDQTQIKQMIPNFLEGIEFSFNHEKSVFVSYKGLYQNEFKNWF